MSAVNMVWEQPKPHYYMVKGLDELYVITKDHPGITATVIKSGLTKLEAEAFMKLLKEQ